MAFFFNLFFSFRNAQEHKTVQHLLEDILFTKVLRRAARGIFLTNQAVIVGSVLVILSYQGYSI